MELPLEVAGVCEPQVHEKHVGMKQTLYLVISPKGLGTGRGDRYKITETEEEGGIGNYFQ